MKVFFDANVLLAAFLAEGTCKAVFRSAVDGDYQGLVTEQVLDEVSRNLGKLVKLTPEKRGQVIEIIRATCEIVAVPNVVKAICRDPSDDAIIAAAAANADVLVTGDKDILALARDRAGIEVLRPADLLRRLG